MMRASLVSLLVLVFSISDQSYATSSDRSSASPNHPPLIDFFAKEGRSTSTHHNYGQSAQFHDHLRQVNSDKQVDATLPDLDLSLRPAILKETNAASSSHTLVDVHPTIENPTHQQRRYLKYPWQKKLSDAQVEEIYEMIGSKWKSMAYSTLNNSLEKVDKYLDKRPYLIEAILNLHDEKTVEVVARIGAPSRTSKRLHRGAIPKTKYPLTVSELLARRKANPGKADGMISYQRMETVGPKWSRNMLKEDRVKLLDRLHQEWNVPPETVNSRLYRFKPEVVQMHLQGLLSDDHQLQKEHADQLLSHMKNLYFPPFKGPFRRPHQDVSALHNPHMQHSTNL